MIGGATTYLRAVGRTFGRIVAPAQASAEAKPKPAHGGFRPDVEGLRAVAVGVVLLYHAGVPFAPGGYVGVDVFFVISGFLITRQLIDAGRTRRLGALPNFYVRRIRRLLPASTVVVLATVAAARIWAPPLQQDSIAFDALFTSFYALNYRLADSGTQYLHTNDAVSPLQHFWSLGVEEQFYLIWPLLLVLVMVAAGRRWRGALATMLVGLIGISFYFSVTVTQTVASWAYFSLHTRGWELAVGALVAVAAPLLVRMPSRLANVLASGGLVAMIASAFTFSPATSFPGFAAAWPVLATAAVIAAGMGGRRRVDRVLGEPMLQSIGRVSYSWYLWHWPMLVLAPMVLGRSLTFADRLSVVVVSLAAAIVTFFAVEERCRWSIKAAWRGFGFGFLLQGATAAVAVVVALTLPALVGGGAAAQLATADKASATVEAQMASAVAEGVETVAAPRNLTPGVAEAATDLPAADGTNCHADFLTVQQGACVYGNPAGTHTAVIVGDSHADVWLPAFDRAGKASDWKVVDWTKSACPAAAMSVYNSVLQRRYTECDAWRADVLKRITALKPDVVVISGSENLVKADVTNDRYSDAFLTTMRTLRDDAQTRVVLMADVPVPGRDLPGCVAANLSDVRACTFPLAKAYAYPQRHRALSEAAAAEKFDVVDPATSICHDGTCPAVVGNLLTYRDDTHLTASFSAWLAPLASTVLH